MNLKGGHSDVTAPSKPGQATPWGAGTGVSQPGSVAGDSVRTPESPAANPRPTTPEQNAEAPRER